MTLCNRAFMTQSSFNFLFTFIIIQLSSFQKNNKLTFTVQKLRYIQIRIGCVIIDVPPCNRGGLTGVEKNDTEEIKSYATAPAVSYFLLHQKDNIFKKL